jgi:hypothetical protein
MRTWRACVVTAWLTSSRVIAARSRPYAGHSNSDRLLVEGEGGANGAPLRAGLLGELNRSCILLWTAQKVAKYSTQGRPIDALP